MDQPQISLHHENKSLESLETAHDSLLLSLLEVSKERNALRDENSELSVLVKEQEVKLNTFSDTLGEKEEIKECLKRVIENIDGENKLQETEAGIDEEISDFSVLKLAKIADSKLNVYKSEKNRSLSENLAETDSIKECLVRAIEIDEENRFKESGLATWLNEEIWKSTDGVKVDSKLGKILESKLDEYKSEKVRGFRENLAEVESVKECLVRIIESIGGEYNRGTRDEIDSEVVEEIHDFSGGIKEVSKLAINVELMLREYKEAREKENSENDGFSLENMLEMNSIKECLYRIMKSIDGENNGDIKQGKDIKQGNDTEVVEKIEGFSIGIKEVLKLVNTIESMVSEYKETTMKKENNEKLKVLSAIFQKSKSAKESLFRLLERISSEEEGDIVDPNEGTKEESETELGEEYKAILIETNGVLNLVARMALKLDEYIEMRDKEKRELGNSVVSLTEENRDINTLLRVALAEKEAVERSFNRLKGNETKRGAIWGLPRVGFGFIMGPSEQGSDNSSAKSDSSECEEEVVTVVSTVEKIMKNLRLEIAQLKRSLEESRSDTERLQSLTERQAHMISENALYIKQMEDREAMLAHNVEELLMEIRESEEEVARWREACELEVEACKSVVEERDKMVIILKQELEKTKAALETANGKLKLKEELANAAMAAQAASERSLQLTDSRVSVLNERVEELTKQLEEAENKDTIRRKVRYFCWPFRALKVTRRNEGVRSFKRMLPEMQALLHSV